MSDRTEYQWREFSGLFRPSIVSFDFEQRTVQFLNSLRPQGFFNLFFQKQVDCSFDDITGVSTYSRAGTRCVEVVTSHGNCVYLDSDVPRFDELVADFRSACPVEKQS